MVQGQTARCRRKKFHRNGRGPQHRMRWNWNCLDAKQADALRIFDTDFPGISQLPFGKRHSFAQGALPLFGHPLRGQRKELFQFFDCCLCIHGWLKSKNPAQPGRKLTVRAEIGGDRSVGQDGFRRAGSKIPITGRKATKNRCWPRRITQRDPLMEPVELYRRFECRKRCPADCCRYYKEASLS
jgi:hypothetical protein